MTEPPHFTKDDLPHGLRRHQRIRDYCFAVRIDGPFTVQTREGSLTCPDGWLAVDASGYPYPIADAEFQLIYSTQPGMPFEAR